MNIAEYVKLTGLTVTNSTLTSAQITRTRYMLETMLGYPLTCDSENIYNELGKTQQECFCVSSVNTADLDDPDEVQGTYRIFNYNELDKYFFIDPFTTLYKVKLVQVGIGDLTETTGITLKTFDDDEITVHMGRDVWSKYIEHCRKCFCYCSCQGCVQLAVDADWLNEDCIPIDLKYVWADMVTYYVDCKKDIKSESVTTHSYTKFDRREPETLAHNLAIIKRYAGPHGTVGVIPV